MRKIIHIDMDAFFASIEQRDRPELRGRPVIVGGAASERGVVSTCSYEARAYGVHSAMPTARAMRLCPQAILLPCDFRRYREVAMTIRAIFHEYTDLVEPVSIDEAYLDVTENRLGIASATEIARRIQREILNRTKLTASAGVAANKFLAKVASDFRKPAGLTVIPPDEAEAFLDRLPIEKFYGIGRVTAARMRRLGAVDGASLRRLPLETLTRHFGRVGRFYYDIVRGVDERPVEVSDERKSVGRERTFASDIRGGARLRREIRELAFLTAASLQRHRLAGRTVTLKVRYGDFRTVTRSQSVEKPVNRGGDIARAALALLGRTEAEKRPVRLLGVTVSRFPAESGEDSAIQLEFDFSKHYIKKDEAKPDSPA